MKLPALLLALLLAQSLYGCTNNNMPYNETEKTFADMKGLCVFDAGIECSGAAARGNELMLNITNSNAFAIELIEAKIFSAGTCGREELNGTRFPAELPRAKTAGSATNATTLTTTTINTTATLSLVCNVLPKKGGLLNSSMLLRYYDTTTHVLYTSHGNLTIIME